MMWRRIALLAGLIAGVGGVAFAQFPGLFIASPIGTEAINVVNGGPQIASVSLRQVRDAHGYSFNTPSTGFTLSFGLSQSRMQIGGASTLATGTINLTAAPVDGLENCFYTKPVITALTLAAGSNTIVDGITAATATTNYCYIYSASNTTWTRTE